MNNVIKFTDEEMESIKNSNKCINTIIKSFCVGRFLNYKKLYSDFNYTY